MYGSTEYLSSSFPNVVFSNFISSQKTPAINTHSNMAVNGTLNRPSKRGADGDVVQPAQSLKHDANGFLRRSVEGLFLLTGRTVVITRGARGTALAFAFAVAEAYSNVAVLDLRTRTRTSMS